MQAVTNRMWYASALALLLAGVAWRLQTARRRHLRAIPRALPERLQVWEGEGGQNQMPEQPPR
jgi:Flp pilus assembly protein TadB